MGDVHCDAAAVLEAFPALQEAHIAAIAALLADGEEHAEEHAAAADAADAALASPEQRAALAAVLNLGREDHALNAASFERLAAVLSAALRQAAAQTDYKNAVQFMHMANTFFLAPEDDAGGGDPREGTLAKDERIAGLELWGVSAFWEAAMFEILAAEQDSAVSGGEDGKRWKDMDDEERASAQEQEQNMAFGQVSGLVAQMVEFRQVGTEEGKSFLTKMYEMKVIQKTEFYVMLMGMVDPSWTPDPALFEQDAAAAAGGAAPAEQQNSAKLTWQERKALAKEKVSAKKAAAAGAVAASKQRVAERKAEKAAREEVRQEENLRNSVASPPGSAVYAAAGAGAAGAASAEEVAELRATVAAQGEKIAALEQAVAVLMAQSTTAP